jgi:hypothetical protein
MNNPNEGLLHPCPIDWCNPIDNVRGSLIFNRSSTNSSVIFAVLFRWWRLSGRWIMIPDDQLDAVNHRLTVARSILNRCSFVDHVVVRRNGLVAPFTSSKEHLEEKRSAIYAAFDSVANFV